MSASTSVSGLLAAARRDVLALPPAAIRDAGEEHPDEFFRIAVESLADSFDAADAEIYEQLMAPWIAPPVRVRPRAPERVDVVYVLSRVTLGSDIKITSVVLDAMKKRFPDARVTLVGGRKSAELFAADTRIEHLEAQYPRSGPVSARFAFADELRSRLQTANAIVVDPDSRMTQLGLVPVCEPERYFHFPSRVAGGNSLANLTELTQSWLQKNFGVSGEAYVAPHQVNVQGKRPWVAISLGVGDNDSKRIAGTFEADLLRALAERFGTLWLDRGAGGDEAARVTAAADASVRFCEGSFAEFTSIIAQSDFYVGYDSGGQHAAAAAGTPLVSIFAGACSERFRSRWAPSRNGPCTVINADRITPDEVLRLVLFHVEAGHASDLMPGRIERGDLHSI